MRLGCSGRLVISLHGDEVMRAVRGQGGQRNRLVSALRAADWVTACSGWLLDRACSLEPDVVRKSSVIWNGIDGESYSLVEPMVRSRPYILGFGRFVLKKGFDLLIKAFADLERDRELDLVLVGSGPEQPRLRQLTVDRGIAGSVCFPGRAYDEDMVRWIRGAKLVVVPSREEPFGIAALEAAAVGVPLVATKVGGIPEFLGGWETGGTILLCEPEPDSLGMAIDQLLNRTGDGEIDVRRGAHFTESFSWNQRLREYENIFESRIVN
jgi:glycosyltransferase involved in cell wall biosynthesis